MLKVFELKTYIYANDENEIKLLQQALYTFIVEQKNNGRAVTASKLTKALTKARNNFFVNKFLENDRMD